MDNSSKDIRIVVIGGDHYNTYGIVRSLGEAGLRLYVIILGRDKGKSFVLKSRYIANGFCCRTQENAIAVLLHNFSTTSKNILICCSDEAEELILDHYDELKDKYVLPVCKDYKETVRLMNKDAITDLANKYEIRTPQTWHVVNRIVPDDIVYPVITKPLVSTQGHKSDIVLCKNGDELKAIVRDEERCADYLVQEYIEFEKEVSILGAVLVNGEVVFSGCIDKLRTCMIGTTSFGVMVDNSILGDNVAKLESMMKHTGYRGLFSAEFLKKGENFYFLEVNFRNDGNTYVATASGNNLPLQYVYSITEQQIVEANPHYPCYFMLDIEDFLARGRNGVTLIQWNRDKRQADCFLVYNKKDKKPFERKIMNTISSIFRRGIHKVGLYFFCYESYI